MEGAEHFHVLLQGACTATTTGQPLWEAVASTPAHMPPHLAVDRAAVVEDVQEPVVGELSQPPNALQSDGLQPPAHPGGSAGGE